MKTVWKYPLSIASHGDKGTVIPMPAGAEILCVRLQDLRPVVYAMVDPDARLEPKRFRVYWTGVPIEGDAVPGFVGKLPPPPLTYVGTFALSGGVDGQELVFHVFVEGK